MRDRKNVSQTFNDLITSRAPRLIPNPLHSLEDNDRFHHRDLERVVDAQRLWAEARKLEERLASLTWSGRDPFITYIDGEVFRAQAWITNRLARIQPLLRAARRAA